MSNLKPILAFLYCTAAIAWAGNAAAADQRIGILVYDGVLASDVIAPAEVLV